MFSKNIRILLLLYRNDKFLLGPKIKTLFKEIALGSELDSVLTEKYILPIHRKTQLSITFLLRGNYANLATLVDNDGYGYIGINASCS